MAERDSSGRFVSKGDGARSTSIELSEEAQQIIRDLQTMPDWMLKSVAAAMRLQNEYTVLHIQAAYLSFPKDGPPVAVGLRVQSNELRGSVRASAPVISGQTVESAIGSNVEYAAIHEFGGKTKAHDITAEDGGFLRFQIGERVIYRKSVHHPGSEILAREPFQRGINDRLTDYGEAISVAIESSWEKGGAV